MLGEGGPQGQAVPQATEAELGSSCPQEGTGLAEMDGQPRGGAAA